MISRISFAVEVWSKKPETRLHDKDTNKKWTASGRMGFEFLNVVHIVPWWKWCLREGQFKAFWHVQPFSMFNHMWANDPSQLRCFRSWKQSTRNLLAPFITLCFEAALLPKLPVYEPESEMEVGGKDGLWFHVFFMSTLSFWMTIRNACTYLVGGLVAIFYFPIYWE